MVQVRAFIKLLGTGSGFRLLHYFFKTYY